MNWSLKSEQPTEADWHLLILLHFLILVLKLLFNSSAFSPFRLYKKPQLVT